MLKELHINEEVFHLVSKKLTTKEISIILKIPEDSVVTIINTQKTHYTEGEDVSKILLTE